MRIAEDRGLRTEDRGTPPPSSILHPQSLTMRLSLFVLAALSMLACGSRRDPAPRPLAEFLTPYGPPTRPFSPAVRVGNLLFLSGQIGVTSTGSLIPGGIETETRQTLENIRDVLQRTGSSMERIVKCTVMMADMREWDAMNAVYTSFFPRNKPARSSFGATGLALGARVEIECVATVD
jgi:2-iminobutanoate/2-iminopropanoate deaminase